MITRIFSAVSENCMLSEEAKESISGVAQKWWRIHCFSLLQSISFGNFGFPSFVYGCVPLAVSIAGNPGQVFSPFKTAVFGWHSLGAPKKTKTNVRSHHFGGLMSFGSRGKDCWSVKIAGSTLCEKTVSP